MTQPAPHIDVVVRELAAASRDVPAPWTMVDRLAAAYENALEYAQRAERLCGSMPN